MNRTCNGHYFNIEGITYYRCMYDGAITDQIGSILGGDEIDSSLNICHLCDRQICGSIIENPKVYTRTVTAIDIPELQSEDSGPIEVWTTPWKRIGEN